ncbi:MAG: 50S ribosomal protein L35 [Oscillospiraceae bacterium]
MPKLKTHSGAKKRFLLTKSGKIKYQHVNKRHRLNQMATKRKNHLAKAGYVDSTNVAAIKEMLPYK